MLLLGEIINSAKKEFIKLFAEEYNQNIGVDDINIISAYMKYGKYYLLAITETNDKKTLALFTVTTDIKKIVSLVDFRTIEI